VQIKGLKNNSKNQKQRCKEENMKRRKGHLWYFISMFLKKKLQLYLLSNPISFSFLVHF
jgi:hypothetical protein